jgi:hypothetical protein
MGIAGRRFEPLSGSAPGGSAIVRSAPGRVPLRIDFSGNSVSTPPQMTQRSPGRRRRTPSGARAGKGLLVLSPTLAAHLRQGLLKQQGFAAERLAQLALSGEVHDEDAYDSVLWTIAAAKKVLVEIGLSASRSAGAVQLSKDDHPLLVYKALRAQLEIEVVRAEDRAIEGRPDRATVDSELENVVSALRVHLSNSVSARREARLSGSVGETRIIASRVGHHRR